MAVEFDPDFDPDAVEGDGLGNLRAQYKALRKRLDEAQSELGEVRQNQRATSLDTLFGSVKDDTKRAKAIKFYGDGEASEAAVTAWLAENGDLFGVSADSGDGTDDAAARAAAVMSDASDTSAFEPVVEGRKFVGTPEEYINLLNTHKGDLGTLQQLGILPDGLSLPPRRK